MEIDPSIQQMMDEMHISQTEAEMILDIMGFMQTNDAMLTLTEEVEKVVLEKGDEIKEHMIGYAVSCTYQYIMFLEQRIAAINNEELTKNLFKKVTE